MITNGFPVSGGSSGIDISSATVTLVSSSFTYNGTPKTQQVQSVVLSGNTLTEGTDYIISGNTQINAGSYLLYVVGIGNYSGSVSASWSIAKVTGSITLNKSSIEFNRAGTTDTIEVTSNSGGTVSAVSSNAGVATVSVSGSVVTVTSVSEGVATITVTVSDTANYTSASATCLCEYFVRIYGVEWDGTSTTAWTRTDAAAGFTDPVPYISGATSYGSPFDTEMPWSGMAIVEDSEAGTMVQIPKFWYKITQSGSGLKIQITNEAREGFSVSPAHMDRGDGNGERDVVYIGRYHCGATAYKSVTGQSPKVSITRSTARSSIHALGTKIWQVDWAMRFTIWLLYLVEFANWDCQSTIGRGCSQTSYTDSAVFYMGYTNSMPYHTGTMQRSRTMYGSTQYRNIEGLWDNCLDWIDGCYNSSGGLNIIKNPSSFSDSSNGTAVGIPPKGYPSAFSVKNVSGTFPLFIPSSANGSDSTYSCDIWYFDSYYPCVCSGSDWGQGLGGGLFCVSYITYSTGSSASIGCRSMKLP